MANYSQGLTEEKAKMIQTRDGLNAITPPKQTSEIVKFLLALFGGFSALLWLGTLLCFLAFTIQETREPGGSKDYVSNKIASYKQDYVFIYTHSSF